MWPTPLTMIKCPLCQTTHVANTVFCDECGHCLLVEENRETDPLDFAAIGWVGGPPHHSQITPADQEITKSPLLRLKIGGANREIEISLNKCINLGRIDPGASIFPEIDLTGEGDFAKSVSRRHAGIFRQSGVVVIEDLASINGTFINGNRLVPYLPETLNDGDVLQLGRLLIEVRIQSQ